MLFKSLLSVLCVSYVAAEALPWAKANPQAEAAAQAYAEAYAEAEALAHPDPEAYALAASADDCASIACHAVCGYLILNGAACSLNKTDTYSGPYNNTCLCDSDSNFMKRYDGCMECGWTLWKYYGPYVQQALAECNLSTDPTGTLRCSTTLTDSYTKDANAGCGYGGVCVTSGSAGGAGNATSLADSDSDSMTAPSNSSATAVSTSAKSSSKADGSSSAESSSASATTSATSAATSATSATTSANGAQLVAIGGSVIGAAVLALII